MCRQIDGLEYKLSSRLKQKQLFACLEEQRRANSTRYYVSQTVVVALVLSNWLSFFYFAYFISSHTIVDGRELFILIIFYHKNRGEGRYLTYILIIYQHISARCPSIQIWTIKSKNSSNNIQCIDFLFCFQILICNQTH